MITLKFDTQTVTVSTTGAIVHSYQVVGESIFYPRQDVDGSQRGGSHVCLPNFGPDEVTDQPQHGYGRVVEWRVSSQNVSEVVLEHTQSSGEYAGLDARLTYRLGEDGLLMDLQLINSSRNNLSVSPGFHPYFNVSDCEEDVIVNGVGYKVNQLSETRWDEVKSKNNIAIGGSKVTLVAEHLKTLAIWSAHPDRYVCIEPTYAGNAHTGQAVGSMTLSPGEQSSFSCLVSVD